MMLQHDAGQDPAELVERIASATAEVVKRQSDIGIDILNDGEYGKVSYSGYVKERLTGFDGEPRRRNMDDPEFPDWIRTNRPQVRYPTNNGPVELQDPSGVRRDIANLKAALKGVQSAGVFMSAASPGVIDTFMPTTYYSRDVEYLHAVGTAMRDEHRAIVDAAFVLQRDCPDLAITRTPRFAPLTPQHFQDVARVPLAA